mgnify:CR=1 FL=1
MTLPNKLTIMRILFIPLIVVVYYIPVLQDNFIFATMTYSMFINVILFCLAALTDFFDGYLARKNNQITTFGKFADPLADKMLVFTAMLLFVAAGTIPVFVAIIIICREFMVSGIRLVAVGDGDVIAASKLGKYKTATTMFALIFYFFYGINTPVDVIAQILLYISLALTVISGIDYFYKNRKTLLKSM